MSEIEFSHIVRIAGTDVRGDYLLPFALTKIRGVGSRLSRMIIKSAELSSDIRIGFLTEEEVNRIEDVLQNPSEFGIPNFFLNRTRDPVSGDDNHVVGQELAISLKNDLDRMKKTQSIKGIRHQLGLTVRGQRTRTSGRGGRTIGVSRKKA